MPGGARAALTPSLRTGAAFPAFEMEVYRNLGTQDFPRTQDGDLAGMVHPQLQVGVARGSWPWPWGWREPGLQQGPQPRTITPQRPSQTLLILHSGRPGAPAQRCNHGQSQPGSPIDAWLSDACEQVVQSPLQAFGTFRMFQNPAIRLLLLVEGPVAARLTGSVWNRVVCGLCSLKLCFEVLFYFSCNDILWRPSYHYRGQRVLSPLPSALLMLSGSSCVR